LEGRVAIHFRTSQTLDTGGEILILKPAGFRVSCAYANMWPMTLPGIIQCRTNETSVTLSLNGTLFSGEHAFVLTMQTPATTPPAEENIFSVLLRDRLRKVEDAAVALPGQELHQNMSISGMQLDWTSSEAGQMSTVAVSFHVNSTIPAGSLGSMLITFPQNYEHAIETEASVKITDKALFPLLNEEGQNAMDISMIDRLSISMDHRSELAAGSYRLEFPVTIPEYAPVYNVWLVTFCSKSDTGACHQSYASHALVTFPLAGFRVGDVAPARSDGQGGVVNSNLAPRSHLVPVAILVSLFSVLLA